MFANFVPQRSLGQPLATPVIVKGPHLLSSSRKRNPSLQIVAGLRSNKDPYSVLGVKPGASEADIKQAHRQLVKKHHPDVKQGDALAHAKFLSIQEAYELLLGKKRGKDIDTPSSKSGWDFHDWYWKFSMRRRKGGSSATTADGSSAHPPPPPSEEDLRHNWRQQVSGLKAKAAAKQQSTAGIKYANGRKADEESSRRSSVWRSTTKNAPTASSSTMDSGSSSSSSGEFGSGSQVNYNNNTSMNPPVSAASVAAAGEQKVAQQQQSFETRTESEHHHEQQSPDSPVEVDPILDAVSAIREAHLRHNHAVKVHVEAAVSQIVQFTHRLRTRLRTADGATVTASVFSTDYRSSSSSSSQGGGGFATTFSTPHTATYTAHHHHNQHVDSLHVEFEDVVREMHRSSGSESDAGGSSSFQSSSDEYVYDRHARKFADRSYVEERLTDQLAGLKRRAALKTDISGESR